MPVPAFNPYKLCPKYMKAASTGERTYMFLTVTRGIDFLLAELWEQYPEEVAMSTIPSWLLPYLSGPLPQPSSTAEADSHFVKRFAYYKDIIENSLAKELLI